MRRVPQQLSRILLIAVIFMILAGVTGQILKHVFHHGFVFGLVPKFDLDVENNVPTWFSSILLFLCAQTAFLIGYARRQQRDRFQGHWLGLAAVLLIFSMEEVAMIHEEIMVVVRHTFGLRGFFFYAWVSPGGVIVLLLAFVFFRFFLNFKPAYRRRIVLALFLYFSGAIGMEMIGGWLDSNHGGRDFLLYGLTAALEESLEMFGVWLLFATLLRYYRNEVLYPLPEEAVR